MLTPIQRAIIIRSHLTQSSNVVRQRASNIPSRSPRRSIKMNASGVKRLEERKKRSVSPVLVYQRGEEGSTSYINVKFVFRLCECYVPVGLISHATVHNALSQQVLVRGRPHIMTV